MEEAQLKGRREHYRFLRPMAAHSSRHPSISPDGRLLEALPTRDAVLPILASLIPITRPRCPLSKMFKVSTSDMPLDRQAEGCPVGAVIAILEAAGG